MDTQIYRGTLERGKFADSRSRPEKANKEAQEQKEGEE